MTIHRQASHHCAEISEFMFQTQTLQKKLLQEEMSGWGSSMMELLPLPQHLKLTLWALKMSLKQALEHINEALYPA